MAIDTLLIVPFEPFYARSLDTKFRQTGGAHMVLPLYASMLELESYIGQPLNFRKPEQSPVFGRHPMPFPRHRSLTAVALATHLEISGLRWSAIDPGVEDLDYWVKALLSARSKEPKTVSISTSYAMTAPWLRALCSIVRNVIPTSRIIIGGSYYATNSLEFLNLDGDVLCVGEGEIRLPQIVEKIVSGSSLETIPGLYFRSENGSLRHTGPAKQLEFARITPPDWSLASRIDPVLDLDRDGIEFGVETQRGCGFKCEFCTFRTLASPDFLSPEASVQAIMATARYAKGFINIVDSTATYPHPRWERLLQLLIQRGGAPHPMWAFARVSDISPQRASLMAKAGVRQVFIGQESGDQAILNLMKKGTMTSQVKPAVMALRQAGIGATFSFMHGFPGETRATMQSTRALIADLNEPDWRTPTVNSYLIYPFICLDFASVSRHHELANVDHYLGYNTSSVTAKQAVEETLATIIEVSRSPWAPVFGFFFESCPPTTGVTTFGSKYAEGIFHWLKAVERGTAIFLERDLEGHSKGEGELPSIKVEILKHLEAKSSLARATNTGRSRLSGAIVRRLGREWEAEGTAGPGLLTRAAAALALGSQSHSWKLASSAWKFGTVSRNGGSEPAAEGSERVNDNLAKELASNALSKNLAPPIDDSNASI